MSSKVHINDKPCYNKFMEVSRLLATSEHIEILDKVDHVIEMIIHSDVMVAYVEASNKLEKDEEAQRLIYQFNDVKELYEDVERFGRYHPDYSEIMRKVRATKRKMDLNETVATFKKAERDIQAFLDEISETIAHSVSDKIIVPKDDLLSDSVCSTGGCGSGGSCNCQVS